MDLWARALWRNEVLLGRRPGRVNLWICRAAPASGERSARSADGASAGRFLRRGQERRRAPPWRDGAPPDAASPSSAIGSARARRRSEEHTSELQSLMRISYAVFCFKKKTCKKY